MNAQIQDLCKELFQILTEKNMTIALAESCTGGQLSAALTAQSGASTIVDRGFITYSNNAKIEMLGVAANTINQHGAVSAQTALEMANGTLKHSKADITASITGIAGPTGGSEEKPVGTVYIAVANRFTPTKAYHHIFKGTRADIQTQSVIAALKHLLEMLQTIPSP